MLPANKRIKDKELINSILKTGKVVRGPLFNIYFKKVASPSQLAVVVSKKVTKKAIIRNKLKRRMANVFREFEKEISPTTKMVLVLKKEMIPATMDSIRGYFKKFLNKQ